MAGVTITVDSREVERLLSGLPPKIQRGVLRKQLRASGNKIARKLKAGTPTGATKRGQKAAKVLKVTSTNTEAFAKIGYKGRPGAYLGMRERGTRRQPARPFFDQAVSGWEEETKRDFMESLKHAVESRAE